MAKIPPAKPADLEALLVRLGFVLARQRGSHRQYRYSDGRGTTIPFHGGRDLASPLIRRILRDIGLSDQEYLERR